MASIPQNFLWILVGSVAYAAANWGILSVFAHTSTAENLGYFSYGLAIANPVFALLSLNLRDLHAADAKGEFTLGHLIAVRSFTNILALLVMCGVAAAVEGALELKLTVVLVAVGKAFDASLALLLGHYQRRQQVRMIALAQIVNGIVSLALVYLMMGAFQGSPVAGAAGYAGGSGIANYLGWCLAKRQARLAGRSDEFRPVGEKRLLLRIAAVGLPLSAATSIGAGNSAVVRHVLGTRVGMDVLGIFSALSYALYPLTMGTNALGQAALARLADLRLMSRRRFMGAMAAVGVGTLAIGLLGAIGAVLFGREFLLVAYGEEYAAEARLFSLLSVANIVTCFASILPYLMLATGVRRAQLLMASAGLIGTVATSLLLLPGNGLTAVPLVLAISGGLQVGVGVLSLIFALRGGAEIALHAKEAVE